MPTTSFFDEKVILITGGTGTLGSAFVQRLLAQHQPQKVIVYSRNERAQVELQREYKQDKRLRFFIGDVRDRMRLFRAMAGVQVAVHAAALKHVDICEYNPVEAIQTNIMGAMNLVDVCIDQGVGKVLAVSTDKAVNPVNLYGASKLCSDKLFVRANVYSGEHSTKFSVVRFGNFWRSNGSFVEMVEKLKDKGVKTIPITDFKMKRFFIEVEDALDCMELILENMKGGETYVPRMQEREIIEVANEVYPDATFIEIGSRPGEKLTEELFAESDRKNTTKWGRFYVTR